MNNHDKGETDEDDDGDCEDNDDAFSKANQWLVKWITNKKDSTKMI